MKILCQKNWVGPGTMRDHSKTHDFEVGNMGSLPKDWDLNNRLMEDLTGNHWQKVIGVISGLMVLIFIFMSG